MMRRCSQRINLKELRETRLSFSRILVPAAGVEPATFRSGGERSNPLSYAGKGLGNRR